MDSEALKVFRVRSRYYSVFDATGNGFPSGVGKEFIAQIPSDPAAFQVWKREKIEYFRAEQDRLDRLRQRSPSPSRYRTYGGYSERPSILKPSLSHSDGWTYIIDLDTDTFIMRAYHIASRRFRLDMIPAAMFAQVSDPSQLMVTPIPQCHMTASYSFDRGFVALYRKSQPALYSMPSRPHHTNPVLRQLRQVVIKNVMRHYNELTFHANGDPEDNAYSIGQLVYGLLNLCDPSTRIVFEHVANSAAYQSLIGSEKYAIPTWDHPSSSEYILRSVIIVIETRMAILEFLQAAIGRAISMAETRPDCRNALIVCIDSVVVVAFTRSASAGLSVSHTDTLLFCPYLLYCSSTADPSPGMTAVSTVFASHVAPPHQRTPRGLPAELWEEVFLFSTAATQDGLSRTCRFFRAISDRFPRFDGWTLERPWRVDQTGFFAAGDDGDCIFRMDEREWTPTQDGYQTVLWVGATTVCLDIPLMVVFLDYHDWVWPRRRA